jgi:O-Antigen ligase
VTAARAAIVGGLLLGPTVLAFFSGGYFDRARLWAGVVAWVGAALAAVVCVRCWPGTAAARLAVAGLAALSLWTIVSIEWAPLRDAAQQDAQRTLIYLGAVLAGIAALRDRRAARAVEPVLALGALVIVCEGLSERLFPGVFQLSRDTIAGGRLTQPLTYWNAMGIVAAVGFVLLARLAGDASRPVGLRVAAPAAGLPVALGLYLTLSRGALLAVAVGVVVLLVLAPNREQAFAVLVMLLGAAPAIVTAALLSDVRTLGGGLASRETEGLAVFAVLMASILVIVGAAVTYLKRHQHRRGATRPDRTVRRIATAGGIAVALATAVVVVVTATSRVAGNQLPTATSTRLATTESIRGDFWRVAVRGFIDNPIRGVGAGGFETEWRRERTIVYSARDAHSLYLETLCELGLVGAIALLGFIAGVVLCARRAYRLDPVLSAGWIAGVSMFAVHVAFDWDWEMPAVGLVAFVLIAAIVGLADAAEAPSTTPARRKAVAQDSPAPVGAET